MVLIGVKKTLKYESMKTLEKYLFISILKSFFWILTGLVLIFSFFKLLDEISELDNKGYSVYVALEHIFFMIPSLASSLLTLAMIIAASVTLGGLNQNNELQMFQIGGVSEKNIVKKTLKYLFLICLFSVVFFEFFAPNFLKISDQIKKQALGEIIVQNNKLFWIKEKRKFLQIKNKKDSPSVIRAFEFDDNSNLINFINTEKSGSSDRQLSNESSIIISINDEGNYLMPKVIKNEFDYEFNLEFDNALFAEDNYSTMNLIELMSLISVSLKNDLNINEPFGDLISRLIKPFTLISMTLITLPFILKIGRNISLGRRIFLAISVSLLTLLLTKISGNIALKFNELAVLGPFLPTIIVFCIGVIFIRKKYKQSA